MKKIKLILGIFAAAVLLASCNLGNEDPSKVTANIDDEVRACFDEVNAFRTGKEAWYWNSDNSTKTDKSGKLDELTLDEDLCKAAQIRADEIVKKWGHTRPDGSSCFTVLKDCEIAYSACGENIAAGQKGGSATFVQWKEEDCDYSGQGHRRNMLGDYTKIGIAYSYDANSTYKYYWTMILIK